MQNFQMILPSTCSTDKDNKYDDIAVTVLHLLSEFPFSQIYDINKNQFID